MSQKLIATFAGFGMTAIGASAHAAFIGTFNPVPEPSVLALFGAGVAGLIFARWLRRK